MDVLLVHMSYNVCAWSPQYLNSLELELQVVVNRHVDAGNQTHVLWKNS